LLHFFSLSPPKVSLFILRLLGPLFVVLFVVQTLWGASQYRCKNKNCIQSQILYRQNLFDEVAFFETASAADPHSAKFPEPQESNVQESRKEMHFEQGLTLSNWKWTKTHASSQSSSCRRAGVPL